MRRDSIFRTFSPVDPYQKVPRSVFNAPVARCVTGSFSRNMLRRSAAFAEFGRRNRMSGLLAAAGKCEVSPRAGNLRERCSGAAGAFCYYAFNPPAQIFRVYPQIAAGLRSFSATAMPWS
jgi:hypothetical protein